jgi:uncharacterized protein
MSKLKISYSDLDSLSKKIYDKVRPNFCPDIVLGIGSGGWLPAKLVNNHFNVEIESIQVSCYNNRELSNIVESNFSKINSNYIINKKILIIDDVNDTGTTLGYVVDKLYNLACGEIELCAAVMHHKDKEKKYDILSDIRTRYEYANLADDVWIDYPWESN